MGNKRSLPVCPASLHFLQEKRWSLLLSLVTSCVKSSASVTFRSLHFSLNLLFFFKLNKNKDSNMWKVTILTTGKELWAYYQTGNGKLLRKLVKISAFKWTQYRTGTTKNSLQDFTVQAKTEKVLSNLSTITRPKNKTVGNSPWMWFMPEHQ